VPDMQPRIQPTLVARGGDTQPTPSIIAPETDAPLIAHGAPANAAKPFPFWRGVVAASIVVVLISAVLAAILLILPATH